MKMTLFFAGLFLAILTVTTGAFAASHWSQYGRYDGYTAPVNKPEPRYHKVSDYATRCDWRLDDCRPVYKPRRNDYGY